MGNLTFTKSFVEGIIGRGQYSDARAGGKQSMATAAATAAAAKAKGPKDFSFAWEGKDKAGKVVRGELRAISETVVSATLRRQGIMVQKVKKQKAKSGGSGKSKDLALFPRQPPAMVKAGGAPLPSLQIVGKGA